jgi:putative PIG3 family NAD(P)H quinone oxidoreductase
MAQSERMNAVLVGEGDGPNKLRLGQTEKPGPGPGEVLIAVEAAGVNRPDLLQRDGLYPPPPGASEILGLEVAGRVEAVGERVDAGMKGRTVCALLPGGGYADYAVASAEGLLPIPDGLSLIEAASLPETFFTVWSNVFDRAGLQPGERFLVHGGTSGIGVAAIQLAKAFGAEVFTTAGSDAKCAAARELGADHAINYRDADYREAVLAATGGKGVDVVLDMVGGSYLERNVACMAPDGRHVSIAFLGGSKAELNFLPVMLKRLVLTGSTLRIRPVAFKAVIAAQLEAKVWPLLAAGKIRPVVDRTFPMTQAAEAHAHMESSAHIGKIVLVRD